jgi:hypothetical protein
MCTWNVTFCIVLLLPLSHLFYSLYCLPVLWVWVALVLSGRRLTRRQWMVPVVLALWWLVETKGWPDTGSSSAISAVRYTVVFTADLMACTASVIGARLLRASASRADDAAHHEDHGCPSGGGSTVATPPMTVADRPGWTCVGWSWTGVRAWEENRTPDLRITSALLYRLSYPGLARTDTRDAPSGPERQS